MYMLTGYINYIYLILKSMQPFSKYSFSVNFLKIVHMCVYEF